MESYVCVNLAYIKRFNSHHGFAHAQAVDLETISIVYVRIVCGPLASPHHEMVLN
jgi:hypothetical protein